MNDTALIIEDEIPAGERLSRLLSARGIKVLKVVRSNREAARWLAINQDPALIFADIELRDGNSFLVLSEKNPASLIIFVTAYSNFALEAYRHKGIDYLLKPVQESQLDQLMERIRFLGPVTHSVVPWQNDSKFRTSFLVSSGHSLRKVQVDQIPFFYSHENCTFLFSDGRNYPVNSSLEVLSSEISQQSFFRISRKFIINRSFINSVTKDGEVALSVANYPVMQISRARMREFWNWYKK